MSLNESLKGFLSLSCSIRRSNSQYENSHSEMEKVEMFIRKQG